MKPSKLISFLGLLLMSSTSGFCGNLESALQSMSTPEGALPIVNFAHVTDGLYRGGRPTEQGMEYLAKLGVKNVIDLQGGDYFNSTINDYFEQGETPEAIAHEKAEATKLGMNFYNIPLSSFDEVSKAEDAEIQQALELMHEHQPIYIHCEHGKDRTGLLVALYRIKYMGWSISDAHHEWEAYGHTDLNQIPLHGLDIYFYKEAAKLEFERMFKNGCNN